MSQTYELGYFPQSAPLGVVPPRQALIVDDDPTQLEILEYRLVQLGYQVTKLTTAAGVVSAARDLQPQLAVLDIQLPDGDGLELCQQLADDDRTSDIPVILLSGTDRADVVRAARAAGGKFFLRKPYDPNALALIIEHASGEW